jgi:hypothetical protein
MAESEYQIAMRFELHRILLYLANEPLITAAPSVSS